MKDSLAQELLERDFSYGYIKLSHSAPRMIDRRELHTLIRVNRDSLEEIRWSGQSFGMPALQRLVVYSFANAALVGIAANIFPRSEKAPIYAFAVLTAIEIPDIIWPRKYRLLIMDR